MEIWSPIPESNTELLLLVNTYSTYLPLTILWPSAGDANAWRQYSETI